MSDNFSGSPSLEEEESRQDCVALKVVHLLTFSSSSERRREEGQGEAAARLFSEQGQTLVMERNQTVQDEFCNSWKE